MVAILATSTLQWPSWPQTAYLFVAIAVSDLIHAAPSQTAPAQKTPAQPTR